MQSVLAGCRTRQSLLNYWISLYGSAVLFYYLALYLSLVTIMIFRRFKNKGTGKVSSRKGQPNKLPSQYTFRVRKKVISCNILLLVNSEKKDLRINHGRKRKKKTFCQTVFAFQISGHLYVNQGLVLGS